MPANAATHEPTHCKQTGCQLVRGQLNCFDLFVPDISGRQQDNSKSLQGGKLPEIVIQQQRKTK